MQEFLSKQLREERAGVVAQLHEMATALKTENREAFTSEEKEKWDKLSAAQTELKDKIDTAERMENLPEVETRKEIVNPYANYKTAKVSNEDRQNALRCWLLDQVGADEEVKPQYRQAAEKMGVKTNRDLDMEVRAMNTDTTSAGYTMSDSVYAGIETVRKDVSGIRQACRVINTASGEPIHWAVGDDTATQADSHSENSDTTTDDLTFTRVQFLPATIKTAVFPVSLELVQDAAFDLIGYITEALGFRIGYTENLWLTGNLSNATPPGLVASTTKGADGLHDASAGTYYVDYNVLLDARKSVNPYYRKSPSCKWMFNDNTLHDLMALTDDYGRPLWQVDLRVGEPDKLLGFPYQINSEMDDIATGTRPILFGDLSKYIVRDVRSITVKVLNERYAEKLAIGVFAYARLGAGLVNSNAIKHVLMP